MLTITDYVRFCQLGPRQNQEDYCLPEQADKNTRLLVLCDGMGGHGHGEVASQTVAESVYASLSACEGEYTAEMIRQAVDKANQLLAAADKFDDAKAMGTTLVIVAVNTDHLLIAHIGDSRCYVFGSDGSIRFRTADHSLVGEAMRAGLLTEEEAFNSPRKNIITRCLMAGKETPKTDIDRVEIYDGDTVMLCSDGVTDSLLDHELVKMLGRGTDVLRQFCDENSKDNNTMILARFAPTGRKAPLPEPDAAATTANKLVEAKPVTMLLKNYKLIGAVLIALAVAAILWMLLRPAPAEQAPAKPHTEQHATKPNHAPGKGADQKMQAIDPTGTIKTDDASVEEQVEENQQVQEAVVVRVEADSANILH